MVLKRVHAALTGALRYILLDTLANTCSEVTADTIYESASIGGGQSD